MIHFLPNNTVTEHHLQGAMEILRDPKRWCKVYFAQKGTLIASMVPSMRLVCLYSRFLQSMHVSDQPNYVRGDLVRGEMQEPFWFLRSALGFFSDYRNVGLFNDAPETKHHQVVGLISLAIKLVQAENEGVNYTVQEAA